MLELIRTLGSDGIYYGKDEKDKEIDFICQNKKAQQKRYQVCAELNESSIDREISPFTTLKGGKGENYLLIEKQNMEDIREFKQYEVTIKPIIEFLLFGASRSLSI